MMMIQILKFWINFCDLEQTRHVPSLSRYCPALFFCVQISTPSQVNRFIYSGQNCGRQRQKRSAVSSCFSATTRTYCRATRTGGIRKPRPSRTTSAPTWNCTRTRPSSRCRLLCRQLDQTFSPPHSAQHRPVCSNHGQNLD